MKAKVFVVPAVLLGLAVIIIVIIGAGLAQSVIAQNGTEVDLQLTSTVSAETLLVGDTITVTLIVSNLDRQQAVGLYIWLYNFSDGLKVEPGHECQSRGSIVWRCELPDLPPEQSVSVEYAVWAGAQALLTGEHRLHQYVASSQSDQDVDNNKVDVNIKVVDR